MKKQKQSNETHLFADNNAGKIVLFDIDYTLFNTAVYKRSNLEKYVLYDEVISVLSKLEIVANLGIFSQGILENQRRKLEKTDIEKYFDKKHIYIVSNKEDVINEL